MRWALLLALVLAVPQAAGQDADAPVAASVPTDLYFHLISIQDFPINTQQPPPERREEVAWGIGAHTLSCLGDTDPPYVGALEHAYHTMRGYANPGPVDYVYVENGQPRLYPERGVRGNVTIDSAYPASAQWFLIARAATEPNVPGPVVAPSVAVRVTVRTGNALSIDDGSYDAGTLILQGQSESVTLLNGLALRRDGSASEQVRASQVDGTWVYGFDIPLTMESPTIPASEGYNVRVDTFVDVPGCHEPQTTGTVMPNVLNAYLDAKHQPRLHVAVVNPIRIDFLHPQIVGDDLLVHAQMRSVWGDHDLPRSGWTLDVQGPIGAGFQLQPKVPRSHCHCYGEDAPALGATYVWKGGANVPGHYDVQFTVANLQATATATASTAFDNAPEQTAPGLPILLGLAALVGIAARRRNA